MEYWEHVRNNYLQEAENVDSCLKSGEYYFKPN